MITATTTTEEMVSDYEHRVLKQFAGFTEASLYDSEEDCMYWFERSQRRFDELLTPRVGDEVEYYSVISGSTETGTVAEVEEDVIVLDDEAVLVDLENASLL